MQLERCVAFAVLLCAMLVARSQQRSSPRPSAAAVRSVVESNNAFSISLYKALSSENGNIAVSPVSVQSVMSLARLGAGGETARQLVTGLHLPENRSVVEIGFRTLLPSLQSTDTVTLDLANKMFISEEFQVKETFNRTAVDYFHSGTERLNFSDSESARTTINHWVEEKTHSKIKDLIKKDSLDSHTLMVIVNAIYFKGGWRKPFPEEETVVEPFYLSSNSTVNVSMMHQRERLYFKNIPNWDAKALILEYRGGNLSMLLILPNEKEGLARLESNITVSDIISIAEETRKTEVIVSLPRFKIEKTLQLRETLQKLGITDIFASGADLSGISDRSMHVSKVVQKAFVEVTEKGTEAAAATYLDVVPDSLSIPEQFKADHPFLFFIHDDTTGTVLFMGRVSQPI